MDAYVLGTAALLASGLFVCGAVAVRTYWLLPWLRSRTVRPEMWGYGAMLSSAGLLLQMTYGPVTVFHNSETVDSAAFITGMLLMIAGAWFQLLASRHPLGK
ncbi:hypothetical protein ACFYXF_07025 [Streptomyces sp. NPDC002680]|uniref:hypothetical protein n=1 Tax=Streptomyces sp. NPDC002680 TaxID=3364659 RepID=UPI0036BDF833